MKFAALECALKLIFLTLTLSACAGAPVIRPHILDTQLQEMREYKFTSDYRLSSEPTAVHEMQWGRGSYGNGFMCFDIKEARAMRDWAMKEKHRCEQKGNE